MNKERFLKCLAIAAKRSKFPDAGQFIRLVSQVEKAPFEADWEGIIGLTFSEMQPLVDKALEPGSETRVQEIEAAGIQVVVLGSKEYPPLLSQNLAPPFVLFTKGRAGRSWHPEGHDLFSIVGSRRASLPMCETASAFARALSEVDGCIVSGLAFGIDAAAHRGALQGSSSFPTAAVLGHGLNYLYPHAHRDLAAQILERGGMLISHYEPEEPPLPRNFLERNSVIAGMSRGTLIVQASKKSGSLSTARFALDAGRELYVIPGDISDPSFSGSNFLLKQGAFLTTEVSDLIELFPLIGKNSEKTQARELLNETQRLIVEALRKQSALHLNDILSSLSQCRDLHRELLSLELSGAISRLPGNYLRLTPRT